MKEKIKKLASQVEEENFADELEMVSLLINHACLNYCYKKKSPCKVSVKSHA